MQRDRKILAWLIENHYLGHKRVDVADRRQAASCRHRAKVLFEITGVIGFMIALRKQLQHAVVIRLIADLE